MFYRLLSTVLFASTALSLAPSLAAQNHVEPDADSGEIIVTATKIRSNVNALGVSVSVLDGEPLNRLDLSLIHI